MRECTRINELRNHSLSEVPLNMAHPDWAARSEQ
jgi:hypothetical protein